MAESGGSGRSTIDAVVYLAGLAFRLVAYVVIVWIVAGAVPRALEAVAGKDTNFNFTFAFSVSVMYSVAATGAVGAVAVKNRRLKRQLRAAEARHPVLPVPPVENAQPGDGGSR